MSILGSAVLKGVVAFDEYMIDQAMIMEELHSYTFTLESVPKLIRDLKKLHENNFYHTDINPTDIMQCKDKQAVFIDFEKERSSNFFYPTHKDSDKWNKYDLQALGKVLFVFKHMNKINHYLSNSFGLDTKNNDGLFFEQEFYKFYQSQSKSNDDNFLIGLKNCL